MRFLRGKPPSGKSANRRSPSAGTGAGKSKPAGPAKRAARKAGAKRTRVVLRARTIAWGAAASFLIAFAGTLTWAISSGWVARQVEAALDAGYAATARWGLAINEVSVAGREQTAREILLTALQVEHGAPLLTFNPWVAQRRVEALPWIRRAAVERRLPDKIFLEIVERKPLAVWQLHGRLVVIDRNGDVIPGAEARRFAELPLVVGEDAPSHTARLLSILGSEPELNQKVTAAVRVASRRWNVQLAGGIDVQLPESGPAQAWAQLATIERKHSVLQRNVVAIDLRLPDRLIIRTQPGVTIERPVVPGGEDT